MRSKPWLGYRNNNQKALLSKSEDDAELRWEHLLSEIENTVDELCQKRKVLRSRIEYLSNETRATAQTKIAMLDGLLDKLDDEKPQVRN